MNPDAWKLGLWLFVAGLAPVANGQPGVKTPSGIAAPTLNPVPALRDLVVKVADAVVGDFTNAVPFDWGEGVLLAGMMRAHALTGEVRYREFVRRFASHWAGQGIGPLLRQKGYCGHWGPALPMLELYQASRDREALALADDVIGFIENEAERTRDGGLSHFSGKPQLWVDTLFMCCPVFTRAARLHERPILQAESVRQLEVFAKHLQDTNTGLFYHMWDETIGVRTPAFWARGNGWVLMSFAETLKNEPSGSPVSRRLTPLLEKQIAGLLPLQDETSGLWHTVLDSPDTYLETSASAMFVYGLAEARRQNRAGRVTPAVLQRAWSGLSRNVDAPGRVVGVSAGTRPGDKSYYARVPQGTFTWGTGAFLLAACALAETGLP